MKPTKSLWIAMSGIVLVMLLGLAISCAGGGGSAGTSPSSNSSQSSTVQVTMSDAPGDSIVSFSVSVDSIVLSKVSGGTVSLLSQPTRVELTHLAGTSTPIATVDIPQDSYNQVAITVSSPQVTVVDPASGNTVTRTLQQTTVRTIALSPALALGGTAVNLNLDLSVGDSVSVDSAGNITFNPRFLASHSPLQGASLPPRFEPLIGRVDSVSGTTFSLNVRFGQNIVRINTDNQTQFVGISGIGSLTPGMMVSVIAAFSDGGQLLARKVISLPAPANIGLEGLVKNTTGSPVTQFVLLAHNATAGLPSSLAGREININVGASTVFLIDSDDFDLTKLPFTPVFTAASLNPGQAVEVHAPFPSVAVTDSTISTTTLIASHITLESQPAAGQVSAFTGGTTFTLLLPSDSALSRITGASSIQVFMQTGKTRLSGTVSGGSVTITNGSRAIVRGLLFKDGGQFKMAATGVVVP